MAETTSAIERATKKAFRIAISIAIRVMKGENRIRGGQAEGWKGDSSHTENRDNDPANAHNAWPSSDKSILEQPSASVRRASQYH